MRSATSRHATARSWAARSIPSCARATRTGARRGPTWILQALDRFSTRQFLWAWLWMVVGCGALYWATSFLDGQGLVEGDGPIGRSIGGLWTAVYFSVVTATTLGFGDVTPVELVRAAAVLEAAILVSRLHMLEQDKIEREIEYLCIAVTKTAGPREQQAWDWLMEAIAKHRARQQSELAAGPMPSGAAR